MKIVSWNVNGFRSIMRKGNLRSLMLIERPDVLLLQEIKCDKWGFDNAINSNDPEIFSGYYQFVLGSTVPGRHGVAVVIRESYYEGMEEDVARFSVLPHEATDPVILGTDREARLQALHFDGILLINTYTVNARQDLSRVPARKEYDQAISNLITMWKNDGGNQVILMGDLNAVSEAVDYHGGKINPNMAGMTDSERESFKGFMAEHNLVDAYREMNQEEIKYSYWSYRGYARDTNRGWRIDYALVSESLMERVEAADILTEYQGSDHAPIVLELKKEVK